MNKAGINLAILFYQVGPVPNSLSQPIVEAIFEEWIKSKVRIFTGVD
jgi:hypothetical protein